MATTDEESNIFQFIVARGSTEDFAANSIASRSWFRKQAQEVERIDEKTLKDVLEVRNKIFPGFMYLFNYMPKLREELPYYDRLPLVFPISKDSEGFLGINLHYLDLTRRAMLMDALYKITNNKKFDETTRLALSYKVLQKVAKVPYYKACIKRYLYTQVKSRYLFVPSNEWDIALFLPLERFVKATKSNVHKDSRKIIKGK